MMKKRESKSSFLNKTTRDAHRQKSSESSYGYFNLPSDLEMFSAEPGSRVRLDFLPYEVTDTKHMDRDPANDIAMPGTLWYKKPYKVHRNIGVDDTSYVCPTSSGKRCPICEHRAKKIREGADKEETDALKPSLRNLYAVIPVNSKKYESKVHLFDISQYNFQKLLNTELSENEKNGKFPELEDGLTLRIRFDSMTIGGSKPFPAASRIDFDPREEDYDESIMKEVPNLDKILKILSYEELKSIYFELDDEEDGGDLHDEEEEDDFDEDYEPKPRKSKRVSKKKVEEEEEDEPEDDEDDDLDEDEPEDEPEDDPEEDEPEDDDEEEEEEKPKPRRKPKSAAPKKESKPAKKNTSKKDEKCPHGHRFGIDTEKFDECDECDLWGECLDEKEGK